MTKVNAMAVWFLIAMMGSLVQASGDGPAEIARVGQEGVTQPVFTKRVSPVYPEKAQRIKLEGYVILEAVLCKDGSVRDMKVLRGLGKGKFGFEEASMEALRKWEFLPGKLDGEPADVRMTLKIDFVLRDSNQKMSILAWKAQEGAGSNVKAPAASIAKSYIDSLKGRVVVALPVSVSLDEEGVVQEFSLGEDVLDQFNDHDRLYDTVNKVIENFGWKSAQSDEEGVATTVEVMVPVLLESIR